jgi:hypothetical protein
VSTLKLFNVNGIKLSAFFAEHKVGTVLLRQGSGENFLPGRPIS